MIVFWDWAEQAIWHLSPDVKVFIDGRFMSAYEPAVIRDYLSFIYGGENQDNALTEYPTDMVLIHKQNPAFTRMLSRAGWVYAIDDDLSALFVKESIHSEWLNSIKSVGRPLPSVTEQPIFP
jgi:hypothetical protein